MLTDTHIHLDFYTEDQLPLLLAEAERRGVLRWVVPGVAPEGWPGIRALSEQWNSVVPCFGWHPCRLSEDEKLLEQGLKLLEQELVQGAAAVGEVGLDRKSALPLPLQAECAVAQIRIANRFRLPVVFHFNAPWDAVFALLDRELPVCGGAVHGFGGSVGIARRLAGYGLLLGVNGLVASSRAKKLHATVRELPISLFLCETDAPDRKLSAAVERGVPADLFPVVMELASLRGCAPQTLLPQLEENCCRFFSLPPLHEADAFCR